MIKKSINITEPNTWVNVGIGGTDLEEGTYVFEVYLNDYMAYRQYTERISGIISWFNGTTNSANNDEIPLSKAGHARNNHDIKLRVLRQLNGGRLQLQISDSIAWFSAGEVFFKFRKII